MHAHALLLQPINQPALTICQPGYLHAVRTIVPAAAALVLQGGCDAGGREQSRLDSALHQRGLYSCHRHDPLPCTLLLTQASTS